ncbi:MAG: sodium ion-translocating decarboxylase subunit beta, partial [Clostridia bacterium]|nr:sodium ion-translocating decarboxylase subunit beta [Clostridia bacterium]
MIDNIIEVLRGFAVDSGMAQFFADGGWKNVVMIGISCFLIYLAIHKKFEPLLLLPIAFGMLLTNLP